MKTPEERIAKRRADMPSAYRNNYDRAMGGKSQSAAIKAFCLECVMWQREEVKLCPSVACPLYPYRPYTVAQSADDAGDNHPESTISDNPAIDTLQQEGQ